DLTTARRIKVASGSLNALKGDGFSWSLPVMTVTGGTVTEFTRGGIDYTEVRWTAGGGFSLPDNAQASFALVGGGGCGGRTGGSDPSPGGGGSGEVFQISGLIAAGTYTIAIGAGGVPGGVNNQGGSGSSSTLTGP